MLRHINVGLAVGYHHELMKASRQGYEAGTHQGWHMGGVACYGYKLVAHEHPNPHKRKRGFHRHTLDIDQVRAPVVRRIFDEYLHNPKYTGFQVWNRRARKQGRGRHNPPQAWVWSDEPSHPPLITKQEYQQVQAKFASNARSRRTDPASDAQDGAAQPAHPARTRTQYLFRSRLRCGICGLRMWGHRRTSGRWYGCQPKHQRGGGIPEGHPTLVYVGERPLLDAVTGFLATSIYGPGRHDYWAERLASADTPDPAAPARARAGELEREVHELEARLGRQLLNLEVQDVSAEFRRRVAARVTQLEHELADRRDVLGKLQTEINATPSLDPVAVQRLLACLPDVADALPELPQPELRRLFDSLDLRCIYDPAAHAVDLTVTLVGGRGDDAQVWDVPSAGHRLDPRNPTGAATEPRLTR